MVARQKQPEAASLRQAAAHSHVLLMYILNVCLPVVKALQSFLALKSVQLPWHDG